MKEEIEEPSELFKVIKRLIDAIENNDDYSSLCKILMNIIYNNLEKVSEIKEKYPANKISRVTLRMVLVDALNWVSENLGEFTPESIIRNLIFFSDVLLGHFNEPGYSVEPLQKIRADLLALKPTETTLASNLENIQDAELCLSDAIERLKQDLSKDSIDSTRDCVEHILNQNFTYLKTRALTLRNRQTTSQPPTDAPEENPSRRHEEGESPAPQSNIAPPPEDTPTPGEDQSQRHEEEPSEIMQLEITAAPNAANLERIMTPSQVISLLKNLFIRISDLEASTIRRSDERELQKEDLLAQLAERALLAEKSIGANGRALYSTKQAIDDKQRDIESEQQIIRETQQAMQEQMLMMQQQMQEQMFMIQQQMQQQVQTMMQSLCANHAAEVTTLKAELYRLKQTLKPTSENPPHFSPTGNNTSPALFGILNKGDTQGAHPKNHQPSPGM